MKEYSTVSRAKIIEYLMDNCDKTVSVSDISAYLKAGGHQVNASTIYRFMDKLVSENKVIKYVSETMKTAGYQYVDTGHQCSEHLHLKCFECGGITHLDCHFMDEIKEHIYSEHGFLLQCKNSIIYGVCKECSKL